MEADDDTFLHDAEPMRFSDSCNTSDDDDQFAYDYAEEKTAEELPRDANRTFEVFSPEKIVSHMIECIKEVNAVVQLPVTSTRILLNHFKWDKEKLMETYYSGDSNKILVDAHILKPDWNSGVTQSFGNVRKDSQTVGICNVCFLECKFDSMTGLECGHVFCVPCWTEYLTTKIMDEGIGETISCAAFNCKLIVDDQTVMDIVRDKKVKAKYQYLISKSFVQCNRLLQWCPAPDCPNAIRMPFVEASCVTCTCGFAFCFSCQNAWHDPVRCSYLIKWLRKCEDDSETSNWIAANTKECPKCQVTIEKDGGCNHMICRSPNCTADFCWVCLGPWEPHGSSWYNCNRYDEDDAKNARTGQEKSRGALQRYLFYCNRYMNHLQSLKFEHKLYIQIKLKMEEMQRHNMSWIEVQFLEKAVDVLCKCRQTLMYTYVFAFYLKKNNHSLIFEENQKDLENATEVLSEYLEREITEDTVIGIKQKVQDKSRYCNSRRTVLLAHVHEGYESDFWEYTM